MKKNILIGVLSLIILILGGYLVYDKVISQEKDISENREDVKEKIVFKDIETKDDKIIEYFESNINGTSQKIEIEFTYDKYNEYIHTVEGKLNGTLVYSREYSEEVTSVKKADIFNEEIIARNFTIKNFDTIKGTDDKDYLIVYYYGSLEDSLKIFNSDLKVLTKNLLKVGLERDGFMINYFYNNICKLESGNPFYPNTFTPVTGKNIHVKKENDKIYFLAPVLEQDFAASAASGNYGTLEERVYTIANDELEYQVLNSYKITEVCQQVA